MDKGKSTYLEAALAVLRESGRPLTIREITDSAIESGLISPVGKTPIATMEAVLYRQVQIIDPQIRRLAEPAHLRAKRGTVRWTLASQTNAD